MASGYVQVPPDSTGKKVDCTSLSSGAVRQVTIIGDPTVSSGLATVTGGKLNVNASVGSLPNVTISGTVAVSGTIDKISAAVVLAAGTANIGTIDGISKTVNVSVTNAVPISGSVALAAGSANIGTIDGISKTVNVSITNNVNISNTPSVVVSNSINVSNTPSVVVAAFTDPSGTARNVVDSSNLALRVNVVAGGAGGGIATGPVAPGASVTAANNPVLMGGVDPSSLARVMRVDATGGLIVSHISATVNVAGSFTVGGQTGNATATAGSTFTLVGGTDGSLGRIAATDAAGHFIVTGTVALAAGSANIGTINNISSTVLVSGTVALAAGTANIGTINNISATVAVTGTVALAAGTANIGTINNISAAVVLGAGAANIGSINNISATVSVFVTNTVNVNLAAQSGGLILFVQGGTSQGASVTAANAPILAGGKVKTSISATVAAKLAQYAWYDKAGHQIMQLNAACLPPSATHGPKSVTLSASANTVLVASAGTACVFVDSILVTGNLAAVSRCDIYTQNNSAAPEISGYVGIGGGGFTHKFDPPWQISAGQPLVARLKPSASAQVIATVHFHVGPN